MVLVSDGASTFDGDDSHTLLSVLQPWVQFLSFVTNDGELRAIRNTFEALIWEWDAHHDVQHMQLALRLGNVEQAERFSASVVKSLQAAMYQWQCAASWLKDFGDAHKEPLYAPLYEQVLLQQHRLTERIEQLQAYMARASQEWNPSLAWPEG